MTKYFLFLSTFYCIHHTIIGQRVGDNILIGGTELHTDLYRSVIGEYSSVYTGLQYLDYDNNILGHQFFFSEKPTTGTLVYNGIRYENFPMMYDTYLDEVIVIHDSTTLRTKLVKEKINSFSIFDHHFIYMKNDDNLLERGIYNIVYDGEKQVFVKRKKIIEDYVKDLQMTREFIDKDVFIVYDRGNYHIITKRNSLLQLFGDLRPQVRKYLREENLKFKKNKEIAIIQSISYFESIQE